MGRGKGEAGETAQEAGMGLRLIFKSYVLELSIVYPFSWR